MLKLIKKDVPFVWVEECQTSFQVLKEALVGSKVMAYSKDQGTYILDIDASDSAIGAVLNQEQDGREKLIAFGSRTMNKADANYCVTDKELSIRYFGEYYRQYLLGKRFIVRTEHQALVWLLKLREPKVRKARWIETLSQYDFSVEYRPGTKHPYADAMSRFRNLKECMNGDEDMLEPLKCGPCNKCKRKSEMMVGPQQETEANRDSQRSRRTYKSEQSEHKSGNITPTYNNFGVYGTQELAQIQNQDLILREVLRWVKRKQRPELIQNYCDTES